MANSSMLVLPRMTTSASLSRRVTVASYGGIQPSRIFEPTVVGTPSVVKMSLSASGTPASGPSSSPRGALGVDRAGRAERALGVDVQEGVHLLVDRGDPVQVRLGDLDGGHLAGRRSSAAVCGGGEPGQVGHRSVLPQDLRDPEALLLLRRGRRTAPARGVSDGRTASGRMTLVSGSGCEVGGTSSAGDLGDAGDRADDVVELLGEVVELFVLQLQTRQPGEVGDLLARDARHAAILRVSCREFRRQSYGDVRPGRETVSARRAARPPARPRGHPSRAVRRPGREPGQLTRLPGDPVAGGGVRSRDAAGPPERPAPPGAPARPGASRPSAPAARARRWPRRPACAGGDQPALDRVAAQVAQPLPGLVVLDALGDHEQAERVRQVDGAADDLGVLGVDDQPGHERAVDLELARPAAGAGAPARSSRCRSRPATSARRARSSPARVSAARCGSSSSTCSVISSWSAAGRDLVPGQPGGDRAGEAGGVHVARRDVDRDRHVEADARASGRPGRARSPARTR